MRRVVVMGPPGSGKSSLARRLGARLGLPVFHLDQAFWRAGWVEAPADAFRAEVERLAALPCWVIEGNYSATLACRLAVADTLVVLDVASWRSVWRILLRTAGGYGRVRADAAAGCPERLDPAFIAYAWRWNGKHRARYLARLAAFPGRPVVLRSFADAARFVDAAAAGEARFGGESPVVRNALPG